MVQQMFRKNTVIPKLKLYENTIKKTAHAACYCQLNKQEMHTKTKRMTLTTPLVEK